MNMCDFELTVEHQGYRGGHGLGNYYDVFLTYRGQTLYEGPFFKGIALRGEPTTEEVLYSALMDATEEAFEDWCAGYGYDEDSRKAYVIYEKCRESHENLTAAFSSEEIDDLREYFQDY